MTFCCRPRGLLLSPEHARGEGTADPLALITDICALPMWQRSGKLAASLHRRSTLENLEVALRRLFHTARLRPNQLTGLQSLVPQLLTFAEGNGDDSKGGAGGLEGGMRVDEGSSGREEGGGVLEACGCLTYLFQLQLCQLLYSADGLTRELRSQPQGAASRGSNKAANESPVPTSDPLHPSTCPLLHRQLPHDYDSIPTPLHMAPLDAPSLLLHHTSPQLLHSSSLHPFNPT